MPAAIEVRDVHERFSGLFGVSSMLKSGYRLRH
jgi:hypothetical protein